MIDTTTDCALIALSKQGTILDQKNIFNAKQLSKTLMPLIATFNLQELDYIAVAIGPGTYTGTRVGAIIAQTLSFALKIPLVTFSLFSPDEVYKKYLNGEFAANSQAELIYLH